MFIIDINVAYYFQELVYNFICLGWTGKICHNGLVRFLSGRISTCVEVTGFRQLFVLIPFLSWHTSIL